MVEGYALHAPSCSQSEAPVPLVPTSWLSSLSPSRWMSKHPPSTFPAALK